MGYGDSRWGIEPWGGSASSGGSQNALDVTIVELLSISDTVSYTELLRVVSATPLGLFYVRVAFSNPLNQSFPALVSPSNYSIPGLTIDAVTVLDEYQVLLHTTEQQNQTYTVTVTQAQSLNGDALGPRNSALFSGYLAALSFFAGVQSLSKIEVVFTTAMNVNTAFTDPANYVVTKLLGAVPVGVSSVVPSGPLPYSRATLNLSSPLQSKEFYSVVVSSSVQNLSGYSASPDTDIVQWKALSPGVGVGVEIPITSFSGEISGGLLGTPAGQVFFSPALGAPVSADSTIELEEVSVCTYAYDEYHLPDPPDPSVLYTFKTGGPPSSLGSGMVLWAPAHRLGLARTDIRDRHADAIYSPVYDTGTATYGSPISDTPAVGVLREPLDITRAAFLNDSRWKTFPNPSASVFITATNLTPIGAGPTVNVKLGRNPRFDVRALWDAIGIEETLVAELVLLPAFDKSLAETLAITDSTLVERTLTRSLSDTAAVTDTIQVQVL